MPLLDIASAQPSFRSYLGSFGVQRSLNGIAPSNLAFNKKRLGPLWKSVEHFRRLNLNLGYCTELQVKFLIKAVLTLEVECPVLSEVGQKGSSNLLLSANSGTPETEIESSSEDSAEVDDKEKMRRMRISKANRGNTPWNKGRKHSPETLRRIREKTRLAMQDPKVKMKLMKLGHAQRPRSKETRTKIGVGVRIGWQRRREKLMVQETCFFEWQNLIAQAARRGLVGEEELQWDSYDKLNKQLKQEWVESVEERRSSPRLKGSKRAPKSIEQRRKIADAIAAKWADPEYRNRVYAGLSKYHGTQVGVEKKARSSSNGEGQSRRASRKKVSDVEKSALNATKMKIQQPKLKKRNTPSYKDPLANSKLEMIKNIRAKRAASEVKKNEALDHAKLLIAEAEKAAKALEVAATKSPIARASLIETRKLIAEAIESMESIEKWTGQPISPDNRVSSTIQKILCNDDLETFEFDSSQAPQRQVNGIHAVMPEEGDHSYFDPYKLPVSEMVNGRNSDFPTCFSSYELPMTDQKNSGFSLQSVISDPEVRELLDKPEPHGIIKCSRTPLPNGANSETSVKEVPSSTTIAKKWVRGRLVEVEDD